VAGGDLRRWRRTGMRTISGISRGRQGAGELYGGDTWRDRDGSLLPLSVRVERNKAGGYGEEVDIGSGADGR